VVVSKAGFASDSIPDVVIQNGKTTTVSDVALLQLSGTDSTQTSGEASNIVLVEVETDNIFVTGSGGNETSNITFEVRDDLGIPIDLQHQVRVRFKITGGPGGQESLSPASMLTNALGRVTTTVKSGTIAGPLQVVATVREQGLNLESAPVPLAIHGWLPDRAHFSVASAKLNFAGYNIYGLQNVITAFVGDKYSNPVPPGTAVRFQSTGGIIGGSAVTDSLGRAPVILVSAAPKPPGIPGRPFPLTERGYALITAETVDENQRQITTTTVVLFSGITQLSVTPATFSIPPYGAQLFNYTVSDQNKNPLVAGTSISVTADNGELSGDTNITLEDTQSRAYTHFSFVLSNAKPDSSRAKQTTVTITVKSQNGNASTIATGELLPLVP